MTPEFYQRISDIVSDAARLPVGEQREFVAAACGGDAALRREVESLLEFSPGPDQLLERPVPGKRPATRSTDVYPEEMVEGRDFGVGQRVGAYKLLEKIGQGGMGTVFLAAREDDFEKKVALKLINTKDWPAWFRRDQEGQDLVRRFQNERQILAQLEHPNIARILDGGTSEEGMPYFAMEYVDGVPLDTYCDGVRLSTRKRLQLFRKVCSALQVAHQNLVVHRDLKPNNILVTAAGEPKLLDFGIAKRLVHEEYTTRTGQRPMTLKYASPEQILGRPITTASDTYALGVLLYRLLTGHFPYRLENGEFLTLVKAICDQEPKAPSSAVMESGEVHTAPGLEVLTPEGVSATREGNAVKLRRCLSGDLDSIILKALAKEPERRYGSVEQLSADIGRHLDGLPVLAREGTLIYRSGKFFWRHRVRVAAATVFTLVMSAGLVAGIRARGAERHQEMLAHLVQELLSLEESQDEYMTSLEFLDRGREKVRTLLADEPRLLTGSLDLIAGLYDHRLGTYHDEKRRELAQEIRRLQRLHAGDDESIAVGLNNLAAQNYRVGDYTRAKMLYQASLAMKKRLGQEGVDLAKSLSNLAAIHLVHGEYAEAEGLYLRCLRLREENSGKNSVAVAKTQRSLAVVYYNQGRFEQAEDLLQNVLDIWIAAYGPFHADVAAAWSSLGRVLQALHRPGEAEAIFHHVLSMRQQLLGEDHPHVALTKKDLASVLLDQGEIAMAGRYLDESLAVLHASRPADSWEVAEAESLWGAYLLAQGRFKEAWPCLLDSYQTLERSRGPHAIPTLQARRRLMTSKEVSP